MAIKTQGLTHLHLLVSDIQRSLRFYQGAFGMEVQFWEGEAMVFLGTPGANDMLTLRQAMDGEAVSRGSVDHFGFRLAAEADLDMAVDQVIRAGGALIGRGEHEPGHPYAYVSDPDGYHIEL